MNVLEKMRDLITGDEEERLTADELGERRSEVREEIARLEDRLRVLRSDDGRREALLEAEEPEDLGRRKRRIRDRIEGLEDLAEELLRRQRAAEEREMRRTLHAKVEGLPERADELEAALAALSEARSRFREALEEAVEAHSTLKVRDAEPAAALPDAQVDRLERLAEDLPGHHRVDWLRPAAEDGEPERRILMDPGDGVRYLEGDWSGVDWRERAGPAPTGWKTDLSRAVGIEG